MTAPPQMPPIAPSYLTPATSSFSNPFMAPFNHGSNAPPSQRKSSSPANESNGSANDLLFITGNNPKDFKTRQNMTKIRKKAMGSFLENEKRQGSAARGKRSRLQSEDSNSNASRTSIGSDQDITDAGLSRDEALKIYRKEKRNSSSLVKSPASSGRRQSASSAYQTARSKSPQDVVTSRQSIVQLPRSGITLVYDITIPGPFQSIGKPLDPFQTMFNPSHPAISLQELKRHCSHAFGSKAMGQFWIPTLVDSPHAFLSTICIASAHLDAINERPTESVQTLALRQEVIHMISQQLLQKKVDDHNIIALTQLIASEIIAGDEMTMNYHEGGVATMVKERGGLKRLGVDGRLASNLSWVSLVSAILRESKASSTYTDYCAANSRKYSSKADVVPESPLWRPRNDFETIKRSQRSCARTLELLKDIRMMMDLFGHETKHSRQNEATLKNLYRKITVDYPSVSDLKAQGTTTTTQDWTYEVIRLTSILQAEAILNRTPLSTALTMAAKFDSKPKLYTFTNASVSSESLVSPTTFRHDSPVTGFSIASTYATSPAFAHQQSQPISSTNPFHNRPSITSIASTTSTGSSFSSTADLPFFPPPVSEPNPSTTFLSSIKNALQNSDLSECWGDMAGVLLWIGLVAGTASRKSDKVLKKWFSALAIRCSIFLCFDHPQMIHATMLRMADIVEALGVGSGSSREIVRVDSVGGMRKGSSGKKRKM